MEKKDPHAKLQLQVRVQDKFKTFLYQGITMQQLWLFMKLLEYCILHSHAKLVLPSIFVYIDQFLPFSLRIHQGSSYEKSLCIYIFYPVYKYNTELLRRKLTGHVWYDIFLAHKLLYIYMALIFQSPSLLMLFFLCF